MDSNLGFSDSKALASKIETRFAFVLMDFYNKKESWKTYVKESPKQRVRETRVSKTERVERQIRRSG